MFGPRFLILALGLLVSRAAAGTIGGPGAAEVVVEGLDVFEAPDEASLVTGGLVQGERVEVRSAEEGGWLAINPPPGSFCWIAREALDEGADLADATEAQVIVVRAPVRAGRPHARLPGRPGIVLERGATVRLQGRPPLRLRQGPTFRVWLAIEPPPGVARYIQAAGVRVWTEPPLAFELGPRSREGSQTPRIEPVGGESAEPIALALATVGPREVSAPLPQDFSAALARVESQHRAALRQPVESWHLESVRQGYQRLMQQAADPNAIAAIRARLDQVNRQVRLARAALDFDNRLRQSHHLDQQVAAIRQRLASAVRPEDRPYDAEGLLQPSSKMVAGQQVLALIAPDGFTAAYLIIPPGLDADFLLGQVVGVRGVVHYDEDLRTRLISVRDLDPIDPRRMTRREP